MTAPPPPARARKPVAFLAHSFTDADRFVVTKIRGVLRAGGWSVSTGSTAAALSVSEKVRARIDAADLFVALMTHRHRIGAESWTASPWVIEEKAYSLGSDARRPIVVLLEQGIPTPEETGGLNGDLEYIRFDRHRLDAALRSLREVLRSVAMVCSRTSD